MKYGLQFSKIEDHHYYLGGGFIGTEEIQPDGQWDPYLPPEEAQNIFFETQNCTAFGSENCISILMNKVFHELYGFSERYIGIVAGTDPYRGNDPHKVAEAIRKNGLIPETELTFDESLSTPEDYFQPSPMTEHYLNIGKKWLEQYTFKHEWVWSGDPLVVEKVRLIKEALKRSPVGASVYAWDCDEDGICHKSGQDNHWCCIYGYNQHGWKVFDSYTNSYKLYSFDSDITMAKLYWVTKKDVKVKKSWFSKLVENVVLFISSLTLKTK